MSDVGRYHVLGQTYEGQSAAFTHALAAAHGSPQRPRCLCQPGDGIDMYVARSGPNYILKRMPGTGMRHDPSCHSFELPDEMNGRGEMRGSAIREDPRTGRIDLKLDFPLARQPSRKPVTGRGLSASVRSRGARLTLRGLLHYLWDEAELTHWRPAFKGRRTWGAIRHRLLEAANWAFVGGSPLLRQLYVPEPYAVEAGDAIKARRSLQWARAQSPCGSRQPLMLVIAELKELTPARYGNTAVLKHVPDQGFLMDAELFRRTELRFAEELAQWSTASASRLILIATCDSRAVGAPVLVELCLMPVNTNWIPVESAEAQRLIDLLIANGRSFVKAMRYDPQTTQHLPSVLLTDRNPPSAVFIDALEAAATDAGLDEAGQATTLGQLG